MPQTPLAPWRATLPTQQQQGPVEFRRVSDDGWSLFRPYWQPPPSGVPYFVGQPPITPWAYWPKDEAIRYRVDLFRMYMPQTLLTPVTGAASERRRWEYWPGDEAHRDITENWRLYMPQTRLAPWRLLAENRQQLDAEAFRRVSEDGWATFRFFWTQPASGSPFFVNYAAPQQWTYWTMDEAKREDMAQRRLYMPQTPLQPWVATQAENRQQQGPVEYRLVSDFPWDTFRFFWQAPPLPPPPSGTNYRSWLVRGVGVRTRIVVNSNVDGDLGDTS